METDNLNLLLEKYKKTITKDIVKKLYEKYSIYDKDENKIDEKDIKDYLKKSNDPVKKRCCGVSKSLGVPKQCKTFAITNFDYCKNHMIAYGNCGRTKSLEQNTVVEICRNTDDEYIDLDHLKMKFIEDSFYYVDTNFIYNKLKQKVGYVEDNDFILTDDPYILQL